MRIVDCRYAMASLARLHAGIRRCTACPLASSRRHAVPGAGPASARAMLIGEAPGRKEDELGLPFVGPSGRFLDELLATIGRTRDEFYITSSVKCRPPQNRQPRPGELETCKDLWLTKQIALIRPRLIVCLGRVSAHSFVGSVDLRTQHGTIIRKDRQAYFITYHPAAGMRFPKVREVMIADFSVLNRILQMKE